MNYTDVKARAVKMRKEGYLYAQIADSLHIAKSTAHLWLRDLVLTQEQWARITCSLRSARHQAQIRAVSANRRKIVSSDRLIAREASSVVGSVIPTIDSQRIFCAVMFWCEG